MILNASGGGGGGSLNFKIVGGTSQPDAPSENTIWIDTSVTVDGYAFSSDPPTNPTEGMVWIVTSGWSSAPFSATKKNPVWVYGTGAAQYISGAWVPKTVQIYQNGEWQYWRLDLYNNGDENTPLTGGWQGRAWREASGDTTATPALTRNADNLYATMSGTYSRGAIEIAKDVRFSGFSKLTMEYILGGSASATASLLMIIPRDSTYWGSSYAVASQSLGATGSTKRTLVLDVSAVSGSYDVAVGIRNAGGGSNFRLYSLIATVV